jgi:hypothetical protein
MKILVVFIVVVVVIVATLAVRLIAAIACIIIMDYTLAIRTTAIITLKATRAYTGIVVPVGIIFVQRCPAPLTGDYAILTARIAVWLIIKIESLVFGEIALALRTADCYFFFRFNNNKDSVLSISRHN